MQKYITSRQRGVHLHPPYIRHWVVYQLPLRLLGQHKLAEIVLYLVVIAFIHLFSFSNKHTDPEEDGNCHMTAVVPGI